MSSIKRAAANAANPKLSTGPTTPEGRARSSQNAVKHGLTAKHLVIRPDQQEAFDTLARGLREEIDPQGALELIAFDQLLHAAWNQYRFRELEAQLMSEADRDPLLDEAQAEKLDRLYRYAAAADRSYHRALKELRAFQTDRALRRNLEPESRESVPALASIPALVKQERQAEVIVKQQLDDAIDGILSAPLPGPIPHSRRSA